MDLVKTFHCTRCEHQTRNYGQMLKHYQAIHSCEAGFRVLCGINGCCRDYSSVLYLFRHMRQMHAAFYQENLNFMEAVEDTDLGTSMNIDDVELDEMAPASVGNYMPIASKNPKAADDIACNYVTSLSLKLREDKKISATACQELRHNISFMLRSSRQMLCEDVSKRMTDLGASPMIVNAVHDVLTSPSSFEIACDKLQTDRDVNKYVKAHFAHVQPVQYSLGTPGTDHMQYIPVLETLRMLLQNDDIFAAVINDHQSTDGKLRDICDGSYFKSHPLFGNENHALQIILYYDDFCPVNPLGHRAKKSKIGGFYFMLGNVEPKYRSRLHTLHLAALCFSSHVKKYGFEVLLRPLISDLISLNHEGVTVNRPEGEFTFKGSLLLVVSDNLAAHSIGGFLESFTCVHPCRFCLVSRSTIQTKFVCDAVDLRTPETYNAQLQRIAKNSALQKVYGLKKMSCLNSIPNFHVTSGLPSDVMHDLYEGVVCDVIEYVVSYCVVCNFISLEYLNEQIEHFPYHGTDKVNRPDVVPFPLPLFKFRQTAAKSRCFLRLLPAMIGHKIPTGDSKWEVLLCLLDLHDMLMSPVLSISDTVLIDDMVCAFLEKFSCEFPDKKVKPKMHFLTHYGAHCRMFGPVVNFWSFRFEGKHNYFKEIASRIKCRRNILKTFACKHQYLHSWHLHRTSSYLYRDHVSTTGGKLVAVRGLFECIQSAMKDVIGDAEMLFQVTSVEVDGIVYSCDMAVVTDVQDGMPKLSQICAIFMIDGVPYFVACQLAQQVYWHHFHLYSCKPSTTYHHLQVSDLADAFPLSIYTSANNDLCIVLQHTINL